MKRFMYASIGVLCLSLSALIGFHVGSQTAQAQVRGPVQGFAHDGNEIGQYIYLDNGDVFFRRTTPVDVGGTNHPVYTNDWPDFQLHYVGNFWGSAPVPTSNESWGSIKSKTR